MLGEDFLTRPRLSRIYYDGKFFAYPLAASDVAAAPRAPRVRAAARSPTWAGQCRRAPASRETFEEWVDRQASASRLYDTFFRPYTEKVWGIPGSEIRAEWAAQRIKDFSPLRGRARDPRA